MLMVSIFNLVLGLIDSIYSNERKEKYKFNLIKRIERKNWKNLRLERRKNNKILNLFNSI